MEDQMVLVRDATEITPTKNDDQKLSTDDTFAYTSCPYPLEILKIDDKENTLTFKLLNQKDKKIEKTIQINEYLNSMKKYTYLYSECSLCHKKKDEFKNIPTFSYCIKCDTIICSDCINKHLETNEKNHHNLNEEYIIKNKEKSIKCLLHPKEKNLAFCLKCNTHICKECMKSQKHINHNKINIMEISVKDEIKNILNDIINIYKEKIFQLIKEKEKKVLELSNKNENDKKRLEKQKKNKIKDIKKN